MSEEEGCQCLTAVREQHHRAASVTIRTMEFQCPGCAGLGAYRLGLQSHFRDTDETMIQSSSLDTEGLPPNDMYMALTGTEL